MLKRDMCQLTVIILFFKDKINSSNGIVLASDSKPFAVYNKSLDDELDSRYT